MGSKSDKVKKHKRHYSSKRSKSAGPPDAAKLLRYAVLGKTSKLRELLANPQDWQLCNTATDSGGATPLHQVRVCTGKGAPSLAYSSLRVVQWSAGVVDPALGPCPACSPHKTVYVLSDSRCPQMQAARHGQLEAVELLLR